MWGLPRYKLAKASFCLYIHILKVDIPCVFMLFWNICWRSRQTKYNLLKGKSIPNRNSLSATHCGVIWLTTWQPIFVWIDIEMFCLVIRGIEMIYHGYFRNNVFSIHIIHLLSIETVTSNPQSLFIYLLRKKFFKGKCTF